MTVTLNKDGTPRKIGSGKTKGAGCFAKIKWAQLKEFIKEDEDILVGRVWLRSVGALSQKRGSKKKQPAANKMGVKNTKEQHSTSQKNTFKKAISPPNLAQSPTPPSNSDDDYDPPPLFASAGKINQY